MAKFPVDAPRDRVLRAFGQLGFQMVREGNHITMSRENDYGTRTPLTMSIIAQSNLQRCV